ncbi:MAG: 4-(cytidine 5'-diphospho)-2-C-methyl-D-erythritol kinase [Clostridia bacterium]|nr:4-(cytidine 5'-diphospho)-2-C-methyl-D-erythritol kinase [Clostridia bacterium]
MERREYHNLSAKKCTRNLKIVYNDNGGIFVYIRQWSVIVLNTQAGKAAAKINLAIDVLKKRPDGYHDVSMIMQSVALFDTITVRAVKGDIKVTSNNDKLPKGKGNIVYRAAEYLKIKYSVKEGALINIEKTIPIAAGLAGGSADAALTLKLLNKAWNLRLSRNEILDAGKKLGSDVPFCIQGGTALAEGLGEKLTQLPGIPECLILLAKPAVSISTKEVYEGLKLEEIRERPDIKSMIQYIEGRNLEGITACMCNVLETVTIKKCSQIEELKEKLMEYGALGSIMSGSGPTVFGVFKDPASAYNAYDHIKDMVSEVFLVKTTNQNLDF